MIIEFIKSHYVLMILLLIATIFNFAWLFLNKKELKMNNVFLIIFFALAHTILGIIFVLVFAYLESGFNKDTIGSISLFGGVFFMPLVYSLYALVRKIKISKAFDIFTVSLMSTLFCARINCLVSGCCKGIYLFNSDFRLPYRELELVYYLIFIILFSKDIYNGKSNGLIYPIYMVSYGTFRFVFEFLRESDSSSFFHIAHIWSLISIVIGISLIIYVKYFRGKQNEQIKEE